MVQLSPASLVELARTPDGRKLVRYGMVSGICILVAQVVLFGAQFHWSAGLSNVVAVCVSAVPGYYLNRAWVWGKTGRSQLMREIVPFWGMALLGLLLSTALAAFAEANAASITSSVVGQKLVVNAASLAAFGVLWVGKFMILNRVLFATQQEPASTAEPLG